jgi:Uma2 family endonuclease
MSTLPKTRYTPEEYLDLERKAEYKSEYYDGEIFAMSGASRKHDALAVQLSFLIYQHLRGKGCHTHSADMRVRISPRAYTYPDLSVVCGEPQFVDTGLDTLTNPTLIFEILSPSTEFYDLGRKAALYREIDSLQQLVFIWQDSSQIQISTRQPDNSWNLRTVKGLDASVELTPIGYTLKLGELYESVTGQP